MQVLMNFREAFWLSGGAKSFLAGLRRRLRREGISFTRRIEDHFDLALLNALTDGLTLDQVRRIHARGKPVIHRKVGYRVSGSAQMRAMTNEVTLGDRLQIEMSPFIHHTVFQSNYSRDTFLSSGFVGDYTVILNGADTGVFNQSVTSWLPGFGNSRPRPYWNGSSTFRLAIVTWSMDLHKGFAEYQQFDAALERMRDVEIWFIGRCPPEIRFRNIRMFAARGHRRLAGLLKQCHGFIQMARFETCSNALIEAINCGLPAIYLDSGSAREIAVDYGVEYLGSAEGAITALMSRYDELAERTQSNPYAIDRVAAEYLNLINNVMGRH